MTKTCSNVGTRPSICFLTLLGVFSFLFWNYNILDRGQTQIIGITVSQLCAGTISSTPYCSASDWNAIKAAFAGSRLWNRQAPSITSWWRRLQATRGQFAFFTVSSHLFTQCALASFYTLRCGDEAATCFFWCPPLGGQRSGSSPSMKVVNI